MKDFLIESVKEVLNKVKGVFVYFLLIGNEMIVVLDLNGFCLFLIGKMGDVYVVVFEICVFDVVGVIYICDVELGELFIINDEGIYVDCFINDVEYVICSMEYIYFVWLDFNIVGVNVYVVCKNMGKCLVVEVFIEVDVVIGVLDFSILVVIGYVEVIGILYELGLIKNCYVGCMFI